MEVGIEATVNEALHDAYVRHAINLSRLENAQVREVIAYLNAEVFPEVLGKVEAKMLGLSPRGLGALESVAYARMMDEVKGLLFGGFRKARGDFARQLYRMAQGEAQFTISALGKELKFDFRSKIPDFKTFKRLVYKQPINGHTLGKRFDLLAANTFSRFQREVNIGLANGETADSIVRRIRGTAGARYKDGVLGRARQWTDTEARTATQAVANGAREATHESNGHVVEREQWSAILDDRTCEVCAALDGKTFDVGTGTHPPRHENCRCFRVPVVKSDRQLGFKKGELPEGQKRSLDGLVPAKVGFEKWLRGQDPKVQSDVLGATKARLWRSGRVKLGAFSNDRGKALTLEALAAKEGFDLAKELKKTRGGK
jgi:SPP1 gp7 family putative phage head morphogenesis protein